MKPTTTTLTCPRCHQSFTTMRYADVGALYIPCLHCEGKVATMEVLPPLRVNTIRHQYLYLAVHPMVLLNRYLWTLGCLIDAINAPMSEPDDAEAIRLLEECKQLYRNGDIAATRTMRILLDRIERADPLLHELMEVV